MHILGLILISILLTSCSNELRNIELSSGILGDLPKDKKKAKDMFENTRYAHNLLYVDTRSPNFYANPIISSYKNAKSFGENIENGLLLIGDIKNMYSFQSVSKIYHRKYIKETYSYNDGPFIVGIKNDEVDFIVNFGHMSPICIDRVFQDISQKIDLNTLNGEKAKKITTKLRRYSCEISEVIKVIKGFIKDV